MKISFQIKKVVKKPNEKVFVVGNISPLGNWSIIDGRELEQIDELAWQTKEYIHINAYEPLQVEYKYVKLSSNTPIWEGGDNRKIDLNIY